MQFKSQRFSFYFYSILFTVADGEKSDRSSVINVDISKILKFSSSWTPSCRIREF